MICESGMAGKVYNYGFSLSPTLWTWGSSPKSHAFGSCLRDQVVGNNGGGSHSSTIEKLYAWEKKLYEEVKVEIYFHNSLKDLSLSVLSFTSIKNRSAFVQVSGDQKENGHFIFMASS